MTSTFCLSNTFVVALLVVSHLVDHVDAGVMCYQCDQLPHQRDCDRVVECGSFEECYGERIVTDDALIKFRSGCRSRSTCAANAGAPMVGKRNDVIPCTKCCNTSYCNLETCDIPVTSNRKRCMSCEYALTPTDCNLSIQCNEDEVCYAQSIIHNQERRYRLGCVHKSNCGATSQPGITNVGLGRRASGDYCGQCCAGSNCNRELCPGNNIAKSPLMTPPPLRFCRDNSTSACSTKINQCSDDYYKYYQCPATCRQCGTGPVVTVAPVTQNTVPPATDIAKTTIQTLAPNECRDNPAYTCSNALVCIVPTIASECRVTCNTCNGGPVTSSQVTTTKPVQTTRKTASTTSVAVCTTEDAIPECQCRYLDREADICHESNSFHQLRRFCCYFCYRKQHPNKPCPRCERIEQHEKELVANMGNTIGCIDPSLQN